jgi:NTE family protein
MRRVFAVFLLLPFLGRAQEQPIPRSQAEQSTAATPQPAKHRLKIGVALEGGGALGLAHVGVLQWFDEHHIPIDYVAGTSMGGLVGGFYATGMSTADLRQLIEHTNWDLMLSGQTDYQDLSFRRKEDQRAYPNVILLGLRNGLSIPAGLNAGHQIGQLIDRETLPYYALTSFDNLPVPFRCVATDLVSGKAVVFQNGPLSEALRASMSIPGAFTPVYAGKQVFVDGGLLNSLPTDVARQMGADIVIAVHLETQAVEPKDLKSLFSVLQQSVRVVVGESELRGLAHADIVVSVPLQAYDSTDYTKNHEIMQKGYDAAGDKSKMLGPFALDDPGWQEYEQERALANVPQPRCRSLCMWKESARSTNPPSSATCNR